MPGPSYVVRQVVKESLKAMEVPKEAATFGGYIAGGVSSLIFQDYHTHFVPDADVIADTVDSLSDSADINTIDSFESVAETDNYAQSVREDISTPQQHFGSYDTSDSSDTSSTWSSSGSYLSSSDTIEPNAQYELPDGSYVYGSELKEGAGGNVYNSSSYGQSSSSDSISKSDIKKVS